MRGLDPRIHLSRIMMDGRVIGERSDAVPWTAMPGHDGGDYFPARFSASARMPASVILVRSIGVFRLPAFTSTSCIQFNLYIGSGTVGSTMPCLTVMSKA